MNKKPEIKIKIVYHNIANATTKNKRTSTGTVQLNNKMISWLPTVVIVGAL